MVVFFQMEVMRYAAVFVSLSPLWITRPVENIEVNKKKL